MENAEDLSEVILKTLLHVSQTPQDTHFNPDLTTQPELLVPYIEALSNYTLTPHVTMPQCALQGLLSVKPQVRSHCALTLTISHETEATALYLLALSLHPHLLKPLSPFQSCFILFQVQR